MHRTTHTFLVRLWLEPLEEGRAEWRGQVRAAGDDEVRYFRNLHGLKTLLRQELVNKTIPNPLEGED